MENTQSMASLATPPVTDVQTANILLCHLLRRLNRSAKAEDLYNIAVGEDVISFFVYQDALQFLLESGSFEEQTDPDTGEVVYAITQRGVQTAEELRNFVVKAYRDKLVRAALRYYAEREREQEVKLTYIQLRQGVHVRVQIVGFGDDNLLDVKLYAPDETQAHALGEKIMLNPVRFYEKILDAALSNEEESIDLTDN